MPPKNSEMILELDHQLTRLRTHYDYFEGAEAKEVLEWARFFQRWAKFAAGQGLSWVKPHLQQANFLVSEFSGRKPTPRAYDILKRVMQEAADDLSGEIQQSREKAL